MIHGSKEAILQGRKTSFVVELSTEQRWELERWQRSGTMRSALVKRARVVLLLDQGRTVKAIAEIVGLTERNVRKWAARFRAAGCDGLQDLPGRGRRPVFSPRSGSASGQDGLRATRHGGPVAVAVGLS